MITTTSSKSSTPVVFRYPGDNNPCVAIATAIVATLGLVMIRSLYGALVPALIGISQIFLTILSSHLLC